MEHEKNPEDVEQRFEDLYPNYNYALESLSNKKDDLKQDIEKLIVLGKKKGFLTYDEVNDALSDSVESSEEIDKVFDILDAK